MCTQLPIRALQTSFNTRLLATWEALEMLYHPSEVELEEIVETAEEFIALMEGK